MNRPALNPDLPWQALACYAPHVCRAIEVAAVGRHTLRVTVHPDDAEDLEPAVSALYAPLAASVYPPQPFLDDPCPCGNLGDSRRGCFCTRGELLAHLAILDPVDMAVTLPRIRAAQLLCAVSSEAPEMAAQRIEVARAALSAVRTALGESEIALLRAAVERLGLRLRQVRAVLRIAASIAALAGSEVIRPAHLAEAIQYQERHPAEDALARAPLGHDLAQPPTVPLPTHAAEQDGAAGAQQRKS
jgi:hypothetical protein